MENYNKLVEHFKTIANFGHLSAICGWDAAAMMPSGGNQARSEAWRNFPFISTSYLRLLN
ncbi:thermostable carboxypeptidase 1 [Vibrio variabilis]|uniref:Thermostable carboxypeptidase 1 n=1 Tax=Vibrio variabilis TaxID=990271 RepID=A0ABQ0J9Q5_9VIBR|nr:thermostable carboxypeptidase 1 [Vibrio variabilis]